MENKTIIVQINNDELFKKLQENNKKCLCTVNETDCICDEFKNTKIGVCHCGVFVKKYVENDKKIILFGKEMCPMCNTAKQLMDMKKIEYIYEDNIDKIKETGFNTLPILFGLDEKYYIGEDAIRYIEEV